VGLDEDEKGNMVMLWLRKHIG